MASVSDTHVIGDLGHTADHDLIASIFQVAPVQTTNYTMSSLDAYVLANGSITVTLPTAATALLGKRYTIINIGTSGVTVAAQGANLINGVASRILNTQYSVIEVFTDGTNWFSVAAASAGYVRTTSTFTTPSIAANASSTGTITLANSYRLLSIQTTVAARVRVYTTGAKRDADLARTPGTVAPTNSGLMLEYITTDNTYQELAPLVDGFQDESPPGTAVAISVVNNSTAAAAVGVTLGYIRTE